MKYLYICVAEFEAETPLKEFPEPYFPQIKEGSLKCKQSIEQLENMDKPTIKFYPTSSEYVRTYLDYEWLKKLKKETQP